MKELIALLLLALLILPMLGAVRRLRRLPRNGGQPPAGGDEHRPH
jgi:hypothetical protein